MKQSKNKQARFPVFQERFRMLQGTMSNTEFADFLDMSRQTVGFYCNGDRIPDAKGLEKIARKCNVSSDYLLGLSDEESPVADIRRICNYTGLSGKAVEVLTEKISMPTAFIDTPEKPAAMQASQFITGLLENEHFSSLIYCMNRSVLAARAEEYIELPKDVYHDAPREDIEYEIDTHAEMLGLFLLDHWDALKYFLKQASEVFDDMLWEIMGKLINPESVKNGPNTHKHHHK